MSELANRAGAGIIGRPVFEQERGGGTAVEREASSMPPAAHPHLVVGAAQITHHQSDEVQPLGDEVRSGPAAVGVTVEAALGDVQQDAKLGRPEEPDHRLPFILGQRRGPQGVQHPPDELAGFLGIGGVDLLQPDDQALRATTFVLVREPEQNPLVS